MIIDYKNRTVICLSLKTTINGGRVGIRPPQIDPGERYGCL